MNLYDATYKKQYVESNRQLLTARDKIASLINGPWIHSYYWPSGMDWLPKAKSDALIVYEAAEQQLTDVRLALSILESIEVTEDENKKRE